MKNIYAVGGVKDHLYMYEWSLAAYSCAREMDLKSNGWGFAQGQICGLLKTYQSLQRAISTPAMRANVFWLPGPPRASTGPKCRGRPGTPSTGLFLFKCTKMYEGGPIRNRNSGAVRVASLVRSPAASCAFSNLFQGQCA